MSTYLRLATVISILTIGNIIKANTLPTDHFKSIATGNWNSYNIWQSSHDGVTWEDATQIPTSSADRISITENTFVTVSSSTTSANRLTVQYGATLKVDYPLTIANSDGDDFTIFGKALINSNLSTVGQVSVMNGAEYTQDANKTNSIYSCNWQEGSTFKITFSGNTQPNTSAFINSLNQTFYNFIYDGTNLTSAKLNLPSNFKVNGTLKFLRCNNVIDYVLTSSPLPITYQFNNVEIYNSINISDNVGLVTIQLSGSLKIDGEISTRLCLGKNINTSTYSNSILDMKGNIYIYGAAGINSNSNYKYGTIKFTNTNTTQTVTENANIRRVNYILNPDVAVTYFGMALDQGYSLTLKNNSSLLTNSTIPSIIECSIAPADWSLPLDGWHLLSSPVVNQSLTTGGFTTGSYDFYKWSEAGNLWLNQKVAANNITSFEPGTGYFVSYDNGALLTFGGSLNIASVPMNNLSHTGTSPYSGFHLLGNPFPCSLDWNTEGWNTTNVSGVAQVWDETAGNYLPLAADNGIIAPTQGFFIQATSPVNSITIPATARTHSNQPLNRYIPDNLLRIRITGINDSAFDETVIRLTGDAVVGADLSDGHKLTGSENSPQLYTAIAPGEFMCVNALPAEGHPATVKLYFMPGADNSYMIGVPLNSMQGDVYLEDLKTGSITLLSTGTMLQVDASAGDATDRFVLHFGPVGIAEEAPAMSQLYCHGKNFYFRGCGNMPYRITSLTGKTLAAGTLGSGTMEQVDAPLFKAGVYIVTVYPANAPPVSRKLILQ